MRYLIAGIFIFFSLTDSGCKKGNGKETAPSDTTTVPIPPPGTGNPMDTVKYVKTLEEFFVQDNPSLTKLERVFYFYYDQKKRLVRSGIKINNPVGGPDSITSLLFYNGNSMQPSMIANSTQLGTPAIYDTIYFTYNVADELVKDSGWHFIYNAATGQMDKKPLARRYSYTNQFKITDWYGFETNYLFRRDSLALNTGNKINWLKVKSYNAAGYSSGYAKANTFDYSAINNPMGILNISGTVFSRIYVSVLGEILGNSNHTPNMTIIPNYIDFCSGKIPNTFYLGNYNSLDDGAAVRFDITITTHPIIPHYPAQILVTSGASSGKKFIYKYSYY